MEKKEHITIFTAELARNLLKKGYTIYDIKPDKNDEAHKRSLFIFNNTGDFEKDMLELAKKK